MAGIAYLVIACDMILSFTLLFFTKYLIIQFQQLVRTILIFIYCLFNPYPTNY